MLDPLTSSAMYCSQFIGGLHSVAYAAFERSSGNMTVAKRSDSLTLSTSRQRSSTAFHEPCDAGDSQHSKNATVRLVRAALVLAGGAAGGVLCGGGGDPGSASAADRATGGVVDCARRRDQLALAPACHSEHGSGHEREIVWPQRLHGMSTRSLASKRSVSDKPLCVVPVDYDPACTDRSADIVWLARSSARPERGSSARAYCHTRTHI